MRYQQFLVSSKKVILGLVLFLSVGILQAQKHLSNPVDQENIFESVDPAQSRIHFANQLTVTREKNFFEYGYFYLGGGVAIGDFNNDKNPDIYFTGNMVPNQLYLNKGDLQFQDITESAKVAADDRWITGCSVIDINADGWEDIYVSVAGKWSSRKNILYVNQGLDENGMPYFEDESEAYGLADAGYSIQATFLDYDRDGDLDVFVANYPETRFNLVTKEYRTLMDEVTIAQSDHLYRNNGNNTFTDVTEKAGVLRFGLSLGVFSSDFNKDGYPDLYISNDFHAPDYFYLNNGDGTFSEISQESFQHTAFYGMGVDAADYNNDGLLDIFQLDMAPADNFRSKANMASMDPSRFWDMVEDGFHYQYMYNALQTAVGVDENNKPLYAETAKLSNLETTDWSWAGLFADFDNDGFKDLFITNGIRKDINNKDYFRWVAKMERAPGGLRMTIPELIERMPSQRLDNPIFKNMNGESFTQVNEQWGLHFKGYSNGAAYADLDRDGDLEIIINNVDSVAMIFKNLTVEKQKHNYLSVQLNGPAYNPHGIGARLTLEYKDNSQYHEHTRVRGYQSAVEQNIHFGTGQHKIIDRLTIEWPDGKREILNKIPTGQRIILSYANAVTQDIASTIPPPVFQQLSATAFPALLHQENEYDDFAREVLLPHKMSGFGPALAVADVNGDGLDDIFLGGAKEQSSALFVSKADSTFTKHKEFKDDQYETVDALFFDADRDGDFDLYVVSGGNEEAKGSDYYQDRFYLNDGKGNFLWVSEALPTLLESGSVVIAVDYDGDGDEDLFVGGRLYPGQYPRPVNSYLLENISTPQKVAFQIVSTRKAPDLVNLGMVTDAIWEDYDQDGDPDLIVVGEWMPLTFLNNRAGQFHKDTISNFSTSTTGWWNSIVKGDFDGDGDSDFLLGNLGLNYKYRASQDASFDIFADDFDDNGRLDIVLGYYQDGIQFPVRGKQCSAQQIPGIKKKFPTYNIFASAKLEDIYTPDKLEQSLHYQAREFAHVYVENKGNRTFEIRQLPMSTQIGTVNAIEVFDFNRDGHLDVVMGGNLLNAEVETPRSDACFGWLLTGNGKGEFKHEPYSISGLFVPNETREIKLLDVNVQPKLIFARNNDNAKVYRFE